MRTEIINGIRIGEPMDIDTSQSKTFILSVLVPADVVAFQPIFAKDGKIHEVTGFQYITEMDETGHCKTSRRWREGVFDGKGKPRMRLMKRAKLTVVEDCDMKGGA